MEPTSPETFMSAPFNLGRYAIDAVLPFFSLFKDETVAPTIASVMVIIAVMLAIWFAVSIWRAKRQIDRRVRFMKRCENRQDFFPEFEQFDAMMKRSRLLHHSWNEYRKTLLPTKPGCTVIESTVRPSDFINLAELEHTGLKLKWFHNIPSVFVGFGLLFTFIGLVAALYFASQAIHAVGGGGVDATQQTARMQGALAQLLSTATFKFWTSIAGLGCSIFLGMFYRGSIRRLDGALDALCREIERCTLTVTPEMLANRQIDELREQSSQLKEFTGQLAFNLGQALEQALQKAMPEVMTKAMSPVEEKLESLSRNMAKEFGSVVSDHAGAEIRETSNALLSVKNALLEASRQVEGSGSGLSNQIADAAGDLREAAKAITEGMNGITKAVRADVDKTRDTLDAQLQVATQGLQNAAQAIRESLDDVGGKMRSSSEQAGFLFSEKIADAVTRIETGTQANAEAIQQALTQLRDMTNSTTGTITGQTNALVTSMRESAEKMARGVAEITEQIRQRSQQGIDGLTDRLVKAAEAMQEASGRNSDRIGEAVGRIITAGSQAEAGVGKATALVAKTMETQGAEAAAKVVSGAGQVLGQFKEGVEDLKGSITHLWERLDKVTAAMGTVESKIGQHAQTLDGVNRVAKETGGSLSAAARAMVEAGQPLNQATLALKTNIENSARSVEAAVRALEETQRQSGAVAKELTNTLSELQTIWNRHSTRFDKADENLGSAVIKIMDIVDKNTVRLNEQVKAIDSGLAGSVNQLAGNVEELQLAAREFHEGIKTFSQAAQAQRRVTADTRQPRANGAG